MKEAISAAEENKFSEFSKRVKASLTDKLRNHPNVITKADKLKDLENIKNIFASIRGKEAEKTGGLAEKLIEEPAEDSAQS